MSINFIGKSIKFYSVLLLFIVYGQHVCSQIIQASASGSQIVFAGEKNLVFIRNSNDEGNDTLFLLATDTMVAKIVPASNMGKGFYYLTPREDFEGIVTLKLTDLVFGIGPEVRFRVIKQPILEVTISGVNGPLIERNDIVEKHHLNILEYEMDNISGKKYLVSKEDYKILGFKINLTAKGSDPYEFIGEGNLLPPKCSEILKEWPSGGNVYIEDIETVNTTTLQQRFIKSVHFKIK